MTQGAVIATLCFLLRGTPPRMILLGYKKRGFGAGKLAGLGGRVEVGERVPAAACREVYEEAGVVLHEEALHQGGIIRFDFPHRPAWNQTVYLFMATTWQGEPTESEEMRPAWYALDALPFTQMWDDALYWLPRLVAGEMLNLQITFGEDNATVCAVLEDNRQ